MVVEVVDTAYRQSDVDGEYCLFVTLRAAMREIAKVYGLPSAEIGKVLALLHRRADFVEVADDSSLNHWAQQVCRALNLRSPWPAIVSWAGRLQGHFRNLGLHPGGVVLVPDEIRRYVPVENSASGWPVIQWEKDQIEEAGLVKIDLLGNRSLAVIRDALAAIRRNTVRLIDYALWNPIGKPGHQGNDSAGPDDRLLPYSIPGIPAIAQETLDFDASSTTKDRRCL